MNAYVANILTALRKQRIQTFEDVEKSLLILIKSYTIHDDLIKKTTGSNDTDIKVFMERKVWFDKFRKPSSYC